MTEVTVTKPILRALDNPTNPLIKSFFNSDIAILEFLTDDNGAILNDEFNKGLYE